VHLECKNKKKFESWAKSIRLNLENWSENSHHFLKRCVNVGNMDACYTLGMVSHFFLSLSMMLGHRHEHLISHIANNSWKPCNSV